MKSVRLTLPFRLGKIIILSVTRRHPSSSFPVTRGSPEGGRGAPISADCILAFDIRMVVFGRGFHAFRV